MNNVNDSRVQRYENGHLTVAEEHLAAECMIQIIVNDALVTTLLGSPEDVEELVAGHLMTEHAVDVQSITDIHVNNEGGALQAYANLRDGLTLTPRPSIVTSSCGACDQTNLPDLIAGTPTVESLGTEVDMEHVLDALRSMRENQPSFEQTGGVHAAGLYFGREQSLLVCEDIGRHNAVDKVLGRHALSRLEQPRALLLSGRCGWDIVAKAARAAIPIVASFGAASSLAAQTARSCNITLLSFVKGNKAVVIGPVDGRFKRKH